MLPAAALILAIPWGAPDTGYSESLPLFAVQIYYAIPEVALLAFGVLGRNVSDSFATAS
jgi:hypothetical protein